MKIKMVVVSGLAMVLLTGCVSIKVESREHHHERYQKCERCEQGGRPEKWGKSEKGEHRDWQNRRRKLMREARVSKKAAERTALGKVPKGTIKEAELEREHGKLQWSFDIATPNSKAITEVNVDAVSGDVISVSKESAADEAREGKRDNDRK